MGSVWSRLGSEVTVIEFMNSVGGAGMDAELSKLAQKTLTKQGIKFKLGHKVLSGQLEGEGVKVEVENVKNGKKDILDADVLLVAIGRRPYTNGLNLEKIGLDVDERGRLVIDQEYRTKFPHIRVIGDVTFGAMLAHKAEEEGIAAAEYIKHGHGHVNYGAIPSVMYTHPEFAWLGKLKNKSRQQVLLTILENSRSLQILERRLTWILKVWSNSYRIKKLTVFWVFILLDQMQVK